MSLQRSWLFVLLIFMVSMVSGQNRKTLKSPKLYPYQVYLPQGYQTHPDSLYPVLIYLHGGSHRGNNPELLKEWGPPMRVARGEQFPFIMVFPQCPANKLWITENWFEPLMADLKAKYRIDTKAVYVTGISMGGFGTWQVAMDFPDRIAGIAPLCGSTRDSLEICRIRQVPIWAFHGVNDGLVRVINTDRLVKRLKACNGNIRYSRLENRHHGIWNLYDNNEIFDWFWDLYRHNKIRKPE